MRPSPPTDTPTSGCRPRPDGRSGRASGRTTEMLRSRPRCARACPISTPEQTFLDLAAAGLSLVDLVVAADGMIKAGHTKPERLIAAAEQWHGRGCRRARRAAGLAREGVDSPTETKLRLLIVLAGLPEPRVNLILRSRDGSWHRRYDLAYEHWRLIIEYDGRQHAEDTEQWLGDIFRREELDQMRWRLVVVTGRGDLRRSAPDAGARTRCADRAGRHAGPPHLQARVARPLPHRRQAPQDGRSRGPIG